MSLISVKQRPRLHASMPSVLQSVDPTKVEKIYRYLFFLIVISLSVSVSCLTGADRRNYFLIGMMFLGPLMIISSKLYIPKIDLPLIFIALYSFISQLWGHPESFRLSTVMFSWMFYAYFLAAVRVLYLSDVTTERFSALMKWIIYAFAVVLLLQQFCVLTGLPIINLMSTYGDEWKLNTLSAEPSFTSRYVGILMYSFLVIQDKSTGKKISLLDSIRANKWVWVAFLWVMLTTVSGTAVLVLGIILLKYLNKRNILIIFAVIALTFVAGQASNITALNRATTFLGSVATGDIEKMEQTDVSAATRVVPDILCLRKVDITSPRDIFVGHGIDSSLELIAEEYTVLKGHFDGGMGGMIYCYGILLPVLLLMFVFANCVDKRYLLSTISMLIICVVLNSWNSQTAWLCIVMLYIVNKYDNRDLGRSMYGEGKQNLSLEKLE